MVEPTAVNRAVVGSSPTLTANFEKEFTMGYFSYHKLTIEPTPSEDVQKNISKHLLKVLDWLDDPEKFHYNDIHDESMKWYQSPDHMIEMSREFPDFKFILGRCGEEIADVEVSVFENGYLKSKHTLGFRGVPTDFDLLKNDFRKYL